MNAMNSVSKIHFHEILYRIRCIPLFWFMMELLSVSVVTFIPSRLVNYITYAYFSLSLEKLYIYIYTYIWISIKCRNSFCHRLNKNDTRYILYLKKNLYLIFINPWKNQIWKIIKYRPIIIAIRTVMVQLYIKISFHFINYELYYVHHSRKIHYKLKFH